jgi:hypothetical protein
LIHIVEKIIRQLIKIIFVKKEEKGKRYIRMQPRTDAHVPGARGI